MKKYKLGFTLSELLIALGVMGILAAVLIPIIHNLMPNKNIVMARRAFNVAQAAVSDMINDEFCYPDLTRRSTDPKVGFDDGAGYAKCKLWDESHNGTGTNDYKEKFLKIFANKVGYNGNVSLGRTFQTKEGLSWTIFDQDIDGYLGDFGKSIVIEIDVNNVDNGPNCSHQYSLRQVVLWDDGGGTFQPSNVVSVCTSDWDRYQIKVAPNGKMDIGAAWARNAVKVDKDFIGAASNGIKDEASDDVRDIDWVSTVNY